MVGTIGLAGSKARQAGRLGRWWRRHGLIYTLSAMVGGAILGVSFSLIGAASRALFGSVSGTVIVVGALTFALLDVLGPSAKYASRARQVPMAWKHVFPAPMTSGVYGVTLGVGLISTIYFWNLHALLFVLFSLATPAVGLLAGAAFGAGRALPVLVTAHVTDEEVVDRLMGALDSSRRWLRVASGFGTAVLALGLATLD